MALFNHTMPGLGDDFFEPPSSFFGPFAFPTTMQPTQFRDEFRGGVSPAGRVNGFETVSDNEDAYEIQVGEDLNSKSTLIMPKKIQ